MLNPCWWIQFSFCTCVNALHWPGGWQAMTHALQPGVPYKECWQRCPLWVSTSHCIWFSIFLLHQLRTNAGFMHPSKYYLDWGLSLGSKVALCHVTFLQLLKLLEPISAVTYTLSSAFFQKPEESVREGRNHCSKEGSTSSILSIANKKIQACMTPFCNLEFLLYQYKTSERKYLAKHNEKWKGLSQSFHFIYSTI